METPNLNYVREISGGDKDFEASVLSILKAEFPLEFLAIKKNFENNNYEQVSFDIHKIKHKISMLGMKKSFELASELERNIKNGDLEQYNKFVDVLNRINVYLNTK
ncbi:Hpt domain-containing protein [Polaribacter aestuariivivens]|uniref:Hpt domain-containing protein n=1 Tax=Polaribacter aestuariivivens TaxID=2304626 RepID=UPI003F494ADE